MLAIHIKKDVRIEWIHEVPKAIPEEFVGGHVLQPYEAARILELLCTDDFVAQLAHAIGERREHEERLRHRICERETDAGLVVREGDVRCTEFRCSDMYPFDAIDAQRIFQR